MNTDLPVAIYARVSSEQQSEAKTVESQVADLRAKGAAMRETLVAEQEFVDNGYSGATLIRPALERLRDVIAAGGIDRLYVHCPDRLARNYAHQVLLLDEFVRAGVEVVFLNREVGQTPEDQLLLQVQGMIAEYECKRQGDSGSYALCVVPESAPYGRIETSTVPPLLPYRKLLSCYYPLYSRCLPICVSLMFVWRARE